MALIRVLNLANTYHIQLQILCDLHFADMALMESSDFMQQLRNFKAQCLGCAVARRKSSATLIFPLPPQACSGESLPSCLKKVLSRGCVNSASCRVREIHPTIIDGFVRAQMTLMCLSTYYCLVRGLSNITIILGKCKAIVLTDKHVSTSGWQWWSVS